jgi:hypothetical protein
VPERYHIHVVPTKDRFDRVGKYGTTDWREDCSRCKNCVKLRCLYDNYDSESAYNRDPSEALAPVFECKACLSCVQNCTKGLLSLALSPEFLSLGDAYWRPDMIATLWNQAETGKIPVSGAGYRGPFSGPGFDSMWTDMSEIVRPTRDGIHGREYINTSVDLGSKPLRLEFDASGAVKNKASLIEVMMPVILDAAPWGDPGESVMQARVAAAASLHTLAIIPARHLGEIEAARRSSVVPLFESSEALPLAEALDKIHMIEIADGPEVLATVRRLHESEARFMIAVRLPLRPDAAKRALELHTGGVSVIHVCADYQGRETGAEKPRFIKDVMREIHGLLVQKGVRDEITLIGSGGIALAEHVAKAVICGADLVGVDIPLLIALGCRVCAGDHAGGCAPELVGVDESYAKQRMVNLMGAWHNQLIEMLGAMGIREVRRLRGEVGRAMFMEDLERDAFKDLAREPLPDAEPASPSAPVKAVEQVLTGTPR